MSRRFKVWLDSGANHVSCRTDEVSLGEIGISSDEWDVLPEDEKEKIMRDIAWEQMGWGFAEIDPEEMECEICREGSTTLESMLHPVTGKNTNVRSCPSCELSYCHEQEQVK